MAFHPTGIAAMHRTGIAYRPGIVIVSNQIVIACIHGTGIPQNFHSIELFLHRTGNSAKIASKWHIVKLEFRQTGNLSKWHSLAFHRTAIPAHASCIVRRSRLTSLSGPRPRHLACQAPLLEQRLSGGWLVGNPERAKKLTEPGSSGIEWNNEPGK